VFVDGELQLVLVVVVDLGALGDEPRDVLPMQLAPAALLVRLDRADADPHKIRLPHAPL
jgi:hypothetical protein